jgi:hypothetical protein
MRAHAKGLAVLHSKALFTVWRPARLALTGVAGGSYYVFGTNRITSFLQGNAIHAGTPLVNSRRSVFILVYIPCCRFVKELKIFAHNL